MGDIWLLMAHSDYSNLGKLLLFLSSYKSRNFPCYLEQLLNVRNVKVVEWMRNPTFYQKINKIHRLGGHRKWTVVLIWILKRWSNLGCSYLPLILVLRKHFRKLRDLVAQKLEVWSWYHRCDYNLVLTFWST